MRRAPQDDIREAEQRERQGGAGEPVELGQPHDTEWLEQGLECAARPEAPRQSRSRRRSSARRGEDARTVHRDGPAGRSVREPGDRHADEDRGHRDGRASEERAQQDTEGAIAEHQGDRLIAVEAASMTR